MEVGVLGLGNVLMRDDAFGPAVIATLCRSYDLPQGVAVEDLGTPGLDLYSHLAAFDAILLIDTVRDQHPPGTVHVYSMKEILRQPPGIRMSPHDPGLKETLLTFRFSGKGPRDVRLVGIVPENTGYELGLTSRIAASIPAAVDVVVGELWRWGISLRPRSPPLPGCSYWWMESGDREALRHGH